jgi:hypothetical protein
VKTPPAASWPACLAVVLLFGACASPRAIRIREHQAEFAALDPFSQQLIREGLIDAGFSTAAVYLSLGKPDRMTAVDSPAGRIETWVYKNYLFDSTRNTSFAPRETVSARPGRDGAPTRIANQGVPGGSTAPLQPTIAEMSGPPLATLVLELRDGHVVTARLEF